MSGKFSMKINYTFKDLNVPRIGKISSETVSRSHHIKNNRWHHNLVKCKIVSRGDKGRKRILLTDDEFLMLMGNVAFDFAFVNEIG